MADADAIKPNSSTPTAPPPTAGSAADALCQCCHVDPAWEMAQQELIRPFVIASHGDLAAVKAGLAAEPRLANARLYQFDEAPIEAAAHMGHRSIAYRLLGSGAPLTVHAAVMLGLRETAEAYFVREPALVRRPGAHGIAMMFHAALSGDPEMGELLAHYGGGQDHSVALHAAAAQGSLAMAQWLLAQGAATDALDFQKRTPLAAAMARGANEIADLLRAAGAQE